jgi:ribonuclease Z
VQLSDVLEGYSKALYSNWLLYRPDRLLIDCGEGCATALGNNSYAVEKLFLTHGHIDHVSGLPSLLWARASGMGANEKPLEVFYPRADPYIEDLRTYIQKTSSRLPFSLTWTELDAVDRVPLRSGRSLTGFPTRHLRSGLSLGYKIVENRRRLRSEFAGLAQSEIQQRARAGSIDELMESYEAIVAAFGGDGLPLKPEDVPSAELLVHEATILDPKDRKSQLHSTLDEAVALAAAAGVKNLLLHHVSGRYRVQDIENAARRSAAQHGLAVPAWCLFREKLWKLDTRPKSAGGTTK